MSLLGQKTFKVKASLIFGLAFVFTVSCRNTVSTWHKPYKLVSYDQSEKKLYEPEDLDLVYNASPSYPGGATRWTQHLKNNLKYPHEAYSEGIQGSVFLSFNVKHTGEIKNVRVIRGLGYGCDEEAVRVLLNSGKWNPGTRNGEDVNSSSNIRIVFTLKGKA